MISEVTFQYHKHTVENKEKGHKRRFLLLQENQIIQLPVVHVTCESQDWNQIRLKVTARSKVRKSFPFIASVLFLMTDSV